MEKDNLRQDNTRSYEVGERWIHCSVDWLSKLDRYIAKLWVVVAFTQQIHCKVSVCQLQVSVQHYTDLLVRHIQPYFDFRLIQCFIVRITTCNQIGIIMFVLSY